ncbi:unnamed protein product [Prunus brigantina]
MSDLTSLNRLNPYNYFHPHYGSQSTLMSKSYLQPTIDNQETMIHETAKQTTIGL